MATVDALLTAEEFRLLPEDGQPKELVRGRGVPVNLTTPRHGEVCAKVVRVLGNFVDERDLGRVVSNDSGIITERDPDTVRGADVAYSSYLRLPKGPIPDGYLPVAPELVFEVRSPTDRWKHVVGKVGEYLNAGVAAVCVLDSQTATAHVYFEDQPTRTFEADQDLTFPALLPGFQARVRHVFE